MTPTPVVPALPGVPTLPSHIEPVNQTAQLLFTLGQIPPLLIFIFLAHRFSRAYRTPLPWFMLLGGLVMSLCEPLVDNNGRVWFPVEGQWTAFTDYGVSLPVWLVMAYVWFFGGRAMVIWHAMEQGRAQDRRWIFRHWGLVFLIDAALENVGLYLGLFLYYGHQPFQVGRFPLWWGTINSTTPIVLAAVVMLLRPKLTGARMLLLVPVAACVDAAVNAGIGFITWSGINNTGLPVPLVWAAGAVTAGLAILLLATAHGALVAAHRTGYISLDGSRAPHVPPPFRRKRPVAAVPAGVAG